MPVPKQIPKPNHAEDNYGIEGLILLDEPSNEDNYGIEGLIFLDDAPSSPAAEPEVNQPLQTPNEPEGGSSFFAENVVRPAARAAKSFVKGTVGTATDLVNQTIASPLANAAGAAAESLGFPSVAEGAYDIGSRLSDPEMSASQQIERGFSQATGGLTEARDSTDRIVDAAGEFVSGGSLFKLANGKSVFAGFAPQSTKDLAGLAGAGALGETAKEEGAGPIGQVVATIAGDLLGRGASGGVKGITHIIKDPAGLKEAFTKTMQAIADTPHEVLGTIFRAAPQKVRTEVMNAAKELGIEAPLSVQVNSPLASFAENSFLKSAFAGEKYRDLVRNMNEGIVSTLKNTLNKIHPDRLSEMEAGLGVQEQLGEKIKAVKKEATKLYVEWENKLPRSEAWMPNNTLDVVQDIKSSFYTASPSRDEKTLLHILRDIEENFQIESSRFHASNPEMSGLQRPSLTETLAGASEQGAVPVKLLSGTRRSINAMADWDVMDGGVLDMLKGISGALEKDIYEYTQARNPQLWVEYQNANRFYKTQIGDALRNNFVKTLANTDRPELIMQHMGSESGILAVEKALGKDPKAVEALNAVKRLKLEQLLTDKIIAEDGTIYYGKANGILKDEKLQPILRKLLDTGNPEDNLYKGIEALRTFSGGVKSAGKELANPSGTAIVVADMSRATALATSLLTANPFYIGTAAVHFLSPKLVSHFIADPRFMKAVTKYADGYKGNAASSNLNKLARDVLLAAQRIVNEEEGEE